MKSKTLLVLLPVLSIALTSCGQVMKWENHLDEYVYEMDYHAKFNILQLTDIHWNYNTSSKSSKTYLKKVLEEADRHIKAEQGNDAHIDLVELTGDQFMLANSYHVKTFLSFFEEEAALLNFKYMISSGIRFRIFIIYPKFTRFRNAFRTSPVCVYGIQDMRL